MKIAVVQLCSQAYGEATLADAIARTEAAARDADVVALPESYAGFGDLEARLPWAFDPGAPELGPTIAPFLALDVSATIILGGTPERSEDGRTFNTALVLRDGKVLARYRKEHLFDARLPDGTRLQESRHTVGGAPRQDVVIEAGGMNLGLSICYDLRFPGFYQRLRARGADVLLVPSAFTRPTGAAHWEVLLRARAIETQCFVVAPAQCGEHGAGRASWGHALVVGPWGEVIADAGEEPHTVFANLDWTAVREARRRFGPGSDA